MSDSNSVNSEMNTFSSMPISKVKYSGESGQYVIIGKQMFYRHQLMAAFGGSLTAGITPFPVTNINPAPLGLSAFAFTTFVLSMFNVQAMGVHTPNVVVGVALFYGGVAQFLAGIAEIYASNSFGATALCSYGSFWLAFATLHLKAFGIADAYAESETFQDAIGFFLVGWAIFTLMLVLLTMKSTVAFNALFVCLFITFVFLAAGEFLRVATVTRVGGVFGLITAFLGWYNAFAGTATTHNSYFQAKSIPLPGNIIRNI